MRFDFGQPLTGIIQMAYVVKDVRASLAQWVELSNVGPWFVLDRWQGEQATYRGRPSEAVTTTAMAFSGHMLIELIQPLDDKPSVYRETIGRAGYGFHHFALASGDFDADVRRYERQGYGVVFSARGPGAGRIGYLDTRGKLPGFIELIESGPVMERLFTKFYQASSQWDGADPIRPFG